MEYLNNYKLYSKINLTLHLHQLYSQHIPGACAVLVRRARSACLACMRCLSGVHAMPVWRARGACLVHTQCAHCACLARP